MKQVMRHRWKDPRNVFKVVGALSKNMQIGQAGARGVSPQTLYSYARFAYELPSGNFFQVKVGGLTGSAELRTDTSNIQAAVDEFQHPDTQAPEKATDQVLPGRRRREKTGPSPRNVSVVVLNGNGIAGAAANTSYLLSQKGYRVGQPPDGYQANAPGLWRRTFPVRNRALTTLSNGGMLTVVVGQTFSGRLTPTPVDRTPPRQAAEVRQAKTETLPAVRRASAWKVGYPLQIPTVIERSSVIDPEVPYRVYKIGKSQAVRFTFRTGANEYWGIEETNWSGAPALEDKNLSEVIGGRQYDFYYNGPHLHMVVLRAGGATYWVVNTLLDKLSNETMLAIAKGLKPLHK
jgi:LytR cell envelope-related transcriptional attenuator